MIINYRQMKMDALKSYIMEDIIVLKNVLSSIERNDRVSLNLFAGLLTAAPH